MRITSAPETVGVLRNDLREVLVLRVHADAGAEASGEAQAGFGGLAHDHVPRPSQERELKVEEPDGTRAHDEDGVV
jgi:hypothetical protein